MDNIRKISSVAGKIGIGLIWLILVLIALETGQRALRFWGERQFSLIFQEHVNYKSHGTPSKKMKSPLNKIEPSYDKPFPLFDLPASETFWEEPVDFSKNPADYEKKHRHFPLLDEEDRNHYARINSEIIVEMDKNKTIKSIYGNRYLTKLLDQTIRAVLPVHIPQSSSADTASFSVAFSVPLDGRTIEATVVVQLCRGLNDSSDFFFIHVRELLRQIMVEVLGKTNSENTRWDIPFVQYKKNLRGDCPTNNIGFYGEDISIPKPANVFRIVCIGGSTTEERDYLEKSYPRRLQDKLQKVFNGSRKIEVVNCGTPAINTMGHLLRMPDYLALQPDLIILYFGVNDTNMLFSVPELFPRSHAERWMVKSAFIRFWLDDLLVPKINMITAIQKSTILANTESMLKIFSEKYIPVIICSFACPDIRNASFKNKLYFSIDSETQWNAPAYSVYAHVIDNLNALYRQVCSEKGYWYIPVAETINAHPEYFLDLCHMNNEGSEAKAQIIYDYVERYISEILGEVPGIPGALF